MKATIRSRFTKEVLFQPGFDYIVLGPKSKEKYGRHGMTLRFILRGPKGAIHFMMYTHWMPMIQKEGYMWEPTAQMPPGIDSPMAVDISYHSYVPLQDYQTEPSQKKCVWLGKPCYSDGSSLSADRYMAVFLNKGEDALWKEMEKNYREVFNVRKHEKEPKL